jgi:hypothetical protein
LLDCLVNGEISAHISTADRGLHYGDGVFETIAVLGGMPRFWQLHMDAWLLVDTLESGSRPKASCCGGSNRQRRTPGLRGELSLHAESGRGYGPQQSGALSPCALDAGKD